MHLGGFLLRKAQFTKEIGESENLCSGFQLENTPLGSIYNSTHNLLICSSSTLLTLMLSIKFSALSLTGCAWKFVFLFATVPRSTRASCTNNMHRFCLHPIAVHEIGFKIQIPRVSSRSSNSNSSMNNVISITMARIENNALCSQPVGTPLLQIR